LLFSSLVFLLYFFPIVFIGNVLLRFIPKFGRGAQNIWLLITSLIFYAWGEPYYVLIMMGSIVVNYFLGIIAGKVREEKSKRRAVIIVACILNLSVLFVFKYLGFTIRNINAVAGRDIILFNGLALPIGISFFTFQAMSYVIDVCRKDTDAERNPLYVGLYIALFPQLIAGPIVRYVDIADQIRNRKESLKTFADGCCRFVAGFGKKVLIANSMAVVADMVFTSSLGQRYVYTFVPVTLAWLGLLAYTFQIFFDFGGYSEMAIGLGKMFGFEFKENFNYPYVSKSVVEFWRRWHISLSTWFREYVYFPLGGSRVRDNDVMVRNTLIVWLLTGIWHGAEWTFLLWGLWHGVFIIFERAVKFEKSRFPRPLRHVYAMLVVMFGWMFFRAESFYGATQYLLDMFGLSGNGFYSSTALMFLKEYWYAWLAAIVLSTPIMRSIFEAFTRATSPVAVKAAGVPFIILRPVVYIAIFVIGLTFLVKGSYNPFIYFNF